MKTVLITGVGSGIGEALAYRFLEEGWSVVGVGRHCPVRLQQRPTMNFFPIDLSKTYLIREELRALLKHHLFHIVVLNAGMLGAIKPLHDTAVSDLENVMRLNVWANKELIDALHDATVVRQIVAISSGAAVNGSKGWGDIAFPKPRSIC